MFILVGLHYISLNLFFHHTKHKHLDACYWTKIIFVINKYDGHGSGSDNIIKYIKDTHSVSKNVSANWKTRKINLNHKRRRKKKLSTHWTFNVILLNNDFTRKIDNEMVMKLVSAAAAADVNAYNVIYKLVIGIHK